MRPKILFIWLITIHDVPCVCHHFLLCIISGVAFLRIYNGLNGRIDQKKIVASPRDRPTDGSTQCYTSGIVQMFIFEFSKVLHILYRENLSPSTEFPFFFASSFICNILIDIARV